MSGAWPPPAPSVWKAHSVRPLVAAMVSSTKPLSLSVSLWIATWVSVSSATSGSCRSPPASCPSPRAASGRSRRRRSAGSGPRAGSRCPCPGSPGSSGRPRPPAACGAMFSGPGVQVVAKVPVAGPVPPPSMVVMPLVSASSICCGQMKWMWPSMPPAVTIIALAGDDLGARADDDVHARLHVGVAGLADRRDAAALQPDVGLDDAPVVDDQRVGDHAVAAPRGDRGR